MKTITIDIAPDGETTIDVDGFNGHGCADATKAIEKALGKTAKDAKKPEYARTAKVAGRKQAKQ